MPRIAIIADIHANLFALDAVTRDLGVRDVDEIIVAGDMVGRGPQGNAVVHRVIKEGWSCVRGNHEDYLLSFCHDDIPDSWHTAEEWAASRWMADELDEEAVRFLETLPFSVTSRIDPQIEVFHGSPNSNSEGIGAWTPSERLDAHLNAIEGSILVCAHTHRPLHYVGDGGQVVNVGSVGLPFNGDWRAQYALLTGTPGDWETAFISVEYPRDDFLRYYQRSGFLDQGAITAHLLHQEVQQARPFLVPFLKWVAMTNRPPTSDYLAEFLDLYDPADSMSEFFARVRQSN